MPADIEVLVASSSPISFSSSYLPFSLGSSAISDGPSIVTAPSRSTPPPPLDFPSAFGSNRNRSELLGQSPPIISGSPPTHFTFHGRCSSPVFAIAPRHLIAANNSTSPMPVAVPRRPCLVVRCEEPLTDMLDPHSPNKHKKKVVFADDRGFPLTKVRTMTEPSNMPPRWSFQFLAQVTQGACAEVAPEPWEVTFSQPASDYLDFRNRLDTRNVSLENVIVRESEQAVVGTVKVRNVAFKKEVFVRVTSDGWRTHEDAYGTYVRNTPAAHGVTVLYDTFSFRLTLPPRSRKLEFCVCYRCEGLEFWDNNSGKNYAIKKKDQKQSVEPMKQFSLGYHENKINLAHKLNDAKPDVRIDSWSEFASWNHLNNDTPYW